MKETTILRMPAVLAMTGISRSRIYVYMSRERAGRFGRGMNSWPANVSARPEVQSGTGAACLSTVESTPEP